MRFFSLRQTSRVVLLSMGMTGAIALSLSAQAATVKPAKLQLQTLMLALRKIAPHV